MPPDGHLVEDSSPLSNDAYQRLLDSLTSLEIEPGDRITVDKLVRHYEISQTPIREALARLEVEGLVEKHHLRGYRASDQLNAAELEDLFAVRALLEPAAARWAAQHAQRPHIAQLVELQRGMETRAQVRSYGDFAINDSRFHAVIAQASGNRILQGNVFLLHVHLHLFRVRRDSEVADTAVEEHRLILQAIERRDHILSEAAMRSHIDRSWTRLKSAL